MASSCEHSNKLSGSANSHRISGLSEWLEASRQGVRSMCFITYNFMHWNGEANTVAIREMLLMPASCWRKCWTLKSLPVTQISVQDHTSDISSDTLETTYKTTIQIIATPRASNLKKIQSPLWVHLNKTHSSANVGPTLYWHSKLMP